IEAVTVCIGYGDFLAAAAPRNRGLLDRWLVVTTPADEETRDVCRRWDLECLQSDEGTRGGRFDKGRLVERGLQQLGADCWRLHLDADVVMPSYARHLLELADLDPECIHGCDRVMVRSWGQWQGLLASGWLDAQHDYQNRVRWPEGLAVGA